MRSVTTDIILLFFLPPVLLKQAFSFSLQRYRRFTVEARRQFHSAVNALILIDVWNFHFRGFKRKSEVKFV